MILENNKKKLSDMLLIIKVSMIIFTVIIVYMHLSEYWMNTKVEVVGKINIFTAMFFLLITIVVYMLCILMSPKLEMYHNVFKLKWLIENILCILFISLPVHFFVTYTNEYKYIFLLLILSSTIQYGSKYGMITSLFSSIAILSTDLLYAPIKDGINMIFQQDIIMTGIFIVIGWIFGYYVDLVSEEDRKKENKLNVLNNKLEEKIKQRKEIQKILVNNETCYDILFENSINAVIVHKDGKILYANRSAINLLGYDYIDDFNVKTICEFYTEKQREYINSKYRKIEKEHMSKVIEEETIIDMFGKVIPVSNTSSFFLYKEESAILTVLTDVTNEKKIESLKLDMEKNIKILNETKEFNMLIRSFFINMSHELKTPITVMYSAIQAIDLNIQKYNSDSVERDREYIKNMKQNCLRMIRLINNFVDATRLEAGEMKISKENADIVDTVESIIQKTAQYIHDKSIELIFDTNVEEKLMAFDKEVMKRILLNLISNAIKFGDKKQKIQIDLNSVDDYVFINVKDEGRGIPRNKLDVIFERFGQVDNSLSRECEGSGVGLYLVKCFVELHNGKIKIISSEGEGTEVIICLPVEVLDDMEFSSKRIVESDEEKIQREFSDIYSI
ncbi:sensor histidine kinase [Clostridium butyricum]|uniref:sensor histidine kinase n=1 Tax=Clostridium butyricum TaxID=1492 RepID=UPI002AB184DE|nr:PAS domain-containing sensor histidine kinase [Clostridium butyricum]